MQPLLMRSHIGQGDFYFFSLNTFIPKLLSLYPLFLFCLLVFILLCFLFSFLFLFCMFVCLFVFLKTLSYFHDTLCPVSKLDVMSQLCISLRIIIMKRDSINYTCVYMATHLKYANLQSYITSNLEVGQYHNSCDILHVDYDFPYLSNRCLLLHVTLPSSSAPKYEIMAYGLYCELIYKM